MLTDLNTSVTQISSEALDALFESTPDSTVTADDLTIGKNADGEPEVPAFDDKIPSINLDEIPDADAQDDEPAEDDPQGDTSPDPNQPAPDADPKAKKDAPAAEASVLKSTVDYLVEKGIFKDFEGREELEITEDLYAQILEAQVENIVEERYSARKSSAGEYGQAILDYLEDGGDPDAIIDLFKERKEIDHFDISTDTARQELVSKYYKEVYGWKPERIKRHLDMLASEDDGLELEASEVKEKYLEHYNQQTQELKAQQARQKAAYEAEQVRRKQVFETSIKDALKKSIDDDARRQKIEQSLFKFRKLQDGSQVNDFYVKFAEWQSNPEKYVELVEFITDHEAYLKRKEVELQNKVVDKTFKFVKGNNAVSKNKGTGHASTEGTNKNSATDFSVIFKKK